MQETKAERNKRIKTIGQIMKVLRAEYGSELTAAKARDIRESAAGAAKVILDIQKEARQTGGPTDAA